MKRLLIWGGVALIALYYFVHWFNPRTYIASDEIVQLESGEEVMTMGYASAEAMQAYESFRDSLEKEGYQVDEMFEISRGREHSKSQWKELDQKIESLKKEYPPDETFKLLWGDVVGVTKPPFPFSLFGPWKVTVTASLAAEEVPYAPQRGEEIFVPKSSIKYSGFRETAWRFVFKYPLRTLD